MFFALFILFFVAQPAKGPSVDSNHHGRENGTRQQIEANQSKDTAKYSLTLRTGNNQKTTYETANPPNGGDNWNKIVAISTFILALVTIALAVIGYLQYGNSRRQLWQFYSASERDFRLTRDNSRKELRAYISISTIHDPEKKKYFGVINRVKVIDETTKRAVERDKLFINAWIVKNNGQTPAHNFRGYYWAKVRPEGETVFEPRPIKSISTVTLSKGCDFPVNMDIEDLHPAEINALMNGTGILYVWGSMIYDDAFGESHETNFRYEVTWFSHRAMSVSIMNEGNDAT